MHQHEKNSFHLSLRRYSSNQSCGGLGINIQWCCLSIAIRCGFLLISPTSSPGSTTNKISSFRSIPWLLSKPSSISNCKLSINLIGALGVNSCCLILRWSFFLPVSLSDWLMMSVEHNIDGDHDKELEERYDALSPLASYATEVLDLTLNSVVLPHLPQPM